jgi:hypothetical protein
MMAADRDREQIFKTTGPRLPNETTPAPLQSEWRAFQKRKLCCRTLYNANFGTRAAGFLCVCIPIKISLK